MVAYYPAVLPHATPATPFQQCILWTVLQHLRNVLYFLMIGYKISFYGCTIIYCISFLLVDSQTSVSQTWKNIWIIWWSCADPGSAVLGWDLRLCIFDTLLGNAAASGPLTTLWVRQDSDDSPYVVITHKSTVAVLVGASHDAQFYL